MINNRNKYKVKKNDSNEDYFNSSLLLQNLLSNSLRKEILICNKNKYYQIHYIIDILIY